jgi:LysR family pca operon transcriptional activator
MLRLERIKFRHLHCLVAVAEHGSFVRAAEALSITQPAVSKTLAELEDIVGQSLFLRTRRGVELTAAGRLLLRYASRGLNVIEEGMEKVGSANSIDPPTILIGALPTAAATLLPRLLLAFQAMHSNVHVRVLTGSNTQLIAALRRGELDLVIGRLSEPSEMKGLVFEHLYTEPLLFAVRASHPLLRRKSVKPATLLEYPLLLPDPGTSVRAAADQFFVAAGVGLPENGIESIDVNFCRTYVMSSNAIWCSSAGVLHIDLKRKLLARLPLDTNMTRGPVGLTLRAEPIALGAMKALIDMIHSASSTT